MVACWDVGMRDVPVDNHRSVEAAGVAGLLFLSFRRKDMVFSFGYWCMISKILSPGASAGVLSGVRDA